MLISILTKQLIIPNRIHCPIMIYHIRDVNIKMQFVFSA